MELLFDPVDLIRISTSRQELQNETKQQRVLSLILFLSLSQERHCGALVPVISKVDLKATAETKSSELTSETLTIFILVKFSIRLLMSIRIGSERISIR